MQSTSFELNNEVVRAGAGAGKTTKLTQKVVETAKQYHAVHGSWPRFVVTTFTRKATQELRERLILKACELGDFSLLEFVSSSQNLHISTLHGVFSLFLKHYSHLLDYDSNFQVINDQDYQLLAKAVLRRLVAEDSSFLDLVESYEYKNLIPILIDLHKIRLEFGKIEFENSSHFNVIWSQQKLQLAKDVVLLADQIQEQVDNQKWLDYAQHLRGTAKLLQDESASAEEVLEKLNSFGRRPVKNKNTPEPLIEDLKQTLSNVKKKLELPIWSKQGWQDYEAVIQVLSRLSEKFSISLHDMQKQQAQLTINDLENLTINIINNEPELAQHFANEWDYWLIDEYQDTSPLQVKILEKLIQQRPSFVVGDPQQSIYLFRGARVKVFRDREQELLAEGRQVELLQKNYRSDPSLLKFINDFITSCSSEFHAMQTKSENFSGDNVCAKFLDLSSAEDPSQEYEAVAGEVASLLNRGERLDDICILCSKNNPLKNMAHFLNLQGVPTFLSSSSGFYNRREIKDGLSLLKFLANPHDNENLVNLLRSPYFNIEDSCIIEWSQSRGKESLWTCVKNEEHLKALAEYLEQSRSQGISQVFRQALIDNGYIDYSHTQDSTGRRESNLWKLYVSLIKQEKSPGFNINQFLSAGFTSFDDDFATDESDAVASLEPNCINLMTIHAAKGLQFKHVFLLHAGKAPVLSGTGFNRKFVSYDEDSGAASVLVRGEEDKFISNPTKWLRDENTKEFEAEESLRLLYVAITRAKSSLCISWQGAIEKNSWMSKCGIDLSAGVHKQSHYAYEVICLDSIQADKPQYRVERDSIKLPERLRLQAKPSALGEKISVSSVVEEYVASEQSNPQGAAVDLGRSLRRSNDGVLIHKIFESFKYNSNFDYLDFLQQNMPQRKKELKEAIEWALSLQELDLRSLIKGGETEWGYQYATNRGILEGQVDLFYRGDQHCVIVDYKSGRAVYSEKAFLQLELYALPALKMGFNDIQLVALYPVEKKIFSKKLKLSSQSILEKFRI